MTDLIPVSEAPKILDRLTKAGAIAGHQPEPLEIAALGG